MLCSIGRLIYQMLFIISITLVFSCSPAAQPDDSKTLPTPNPSKLSLTEIPFEEALLHFQDPTSQQIFNGMKAVREAGLMSVNTQARFGPTEDVLTSGVSTILLPGQSLTGYLLIQSTYEQTHTLGLLATLDYQPIQTNYNGVDQSLPEITPELGEWYAFQFSLSALPEGLHTLVVTYIVDPDRSFALQAGHFDPSENEALSMRTQAYEFGLLIWVTTRQPKTVSDWPDQAHAFTPEGTSIITGAALVQASAPPEGPHLMLMANDNVKEGDTVTYYARFVASLGSGEIPVRVLTLWDNVLSQSDVFTVPVTTAIAQEYIPYSIQVPESLAEGEHTLTVVAYPYPYYLRGWEHAKEWSPNAAYFGLLMARLPVQVEN